MVEVGAVVVVGAVDDGAGLKTKYTPATTTTAQIAKTPASEVFI
ncbi:MAG: hypothetical protein ACP5PX_03085 [Candidatus Hadarchaeum sp.]